MNSDKLIEEEVGPNVDSEDIEERIAARRLRISQRIEAQKRIERGGDFDVATAELELSKSRKQIKISRQRITKLLRDGNEFLSNIRVACDARENGRRIEDDEVNRQRREKLEAEAKTAMERFEDITKKWEIALQKEIPQDLHEMLQQQKDSCNNMIDEKNKLINDLQIELKSKDDVYVKDLKKQAEDVDLMIERMDEQVKTMTKTYREELIQIEKSFVSQRDDLLTTQNVEWETKMNQIQEKQTDYLKARQKRVDDFENQLQDLRVQYSEEFNDLKIKLETDVQTMEQQLQMMKATYQLNLEKLEYNFQVLKKRDEENTITKSQQKRKITRLQDVLNNLKVKLVKQEKLNKVENEQLTDDYKRITEQFRDLQNKAKNLLETDRKKFHDIWLMNEEELKTHMKNLVAADRVIHEQQLGVEWTAPDLNFSENTGPILSNKAKAKSIPASQIVKDILLQAEQSPPSPQSQVTKLDIPKNVDAAVNVKELSPYFVKSLLELLCDESGFLVENKLKKLLQPLDQDEQSLMKLDAVFSALGISTEEDIGQLVPFFVNQVVMRSSKQTSSSSSARQDIESNEDEEMAALNMQADAEEDEKESFSALIHPNEVVQALRKFVYKFYSRDTSDQYGNDSARHQFSLSQTEDRDDSEDSLYWCKYFEVVDKERQQLWEALLEGLDKYSNTLTSRAKLLTETDTLRLQNAELRHLLQQYIGSKVNNELQVPPTQVMQMDRIM